MMQRLVNVVYRTTFYQIPRVISFVGDLAVPQLIDPATRVATARTVVTTAELARRSWHFYLTEHRR